MCQCIGTGNAPCRRLIVAMKMHKNSQRLKVGAFQIPSASVAHGLASPKQRSRKNQRWRAASGAINDLSFLRITSLETRSERLVLLHDEPDRTYSSAEHSQFPFHSFGTAVRNLHGRAGLAYFTSIKLHSCMYLTGKERLWLSSTAVAWHRKCAGTSARTDSARRGRPPLMTCRLAARWDWSASSSLQTALRWRPWAAAAADHRAAALGPLNQRPAAAAAAAAAASAASPTLPLPRLRSP